GEREAHGVAPFPLHAVGEGLGGLVRGQAAAELVGAAENGGAAGHAARISSAACSATMTVGQFVWPRGNAGITDASTTRSPSIPRTRSSGVTTAASSSPMRQVPTGW